MQIDNDILKNNIDNIKHHLESALKLSQSMQVEVQNAEGDSELFRKFSIYLTPSLNHWINGMQAGNMRDLNEVLKLRTTPAKK